VKLPASKARATGGDVVRRDYVKLSSAEETLGLQAGDLVHMALQGQIRVCALGGGRSFRVVDIVTRRGYGTTARQTLEPAAVWGPVLVPVQFVREIEETGSSTPHYFDDRSESERMLVPLAQLQIQAGDLVILVATVETLRAHLYAGSPAAAPPTKQQAVWRTLVLDEVGALCNPKALPKYKRGTKCPTKKSVREALVPRMMTDAVFLRAWQQLRNLKEISDPLP